MSGLAGYRQLKVDLYQVEAPVCLAQARRAALNVATFPAPTPKRLEFDNQFLPERRRFVVHSDRHLGGNAAHEAIALKSIECRSE
jgi:hypothetical protein